MDDKMGLRVYYDGPLNDELDTALKEVIESFGYKMWASGYDLVSDQRDLAFEKED